GGDGAVVGRGEAGVVACVSVTGDRWALRREYFDCAGVHRGCDDAADALAWDGDAGGGVWDWICGRAVFGRNFWRASCFVAGVYRGAVQRDGGADDVFEIARVDGSQADGGGIVAAPEQLCAGAEERGDIS